MKNGSGYLASLLILLPLVACAVQQRYSNKIYIENICQVPVVVLAENYNNYIYTEPHLSVELPVGDQRMVGNYTSFGELVHGQIPTNFLLTISAEGQTKIIKRDDLLKLLDGLEPEERRYRREWTIRNKAICPVSTNGKAPD